MRREGMMLGTVWGNALMKEQRPRTAPCLLVTTCPFIVVIDTCSLLVTDTCSLLVTDRCSLLLITCPGVDVSRVVCNCLMMSGNLSGVTN